MPDWKTHIKWALRLGIDKEVADFINKLIDIPDDVLRNDPTELENYIGEILKVLKIY